MQGRDIIVEKAAWVASLCAQNPEARRDVLKALQLSFNDNNEYVRMGAWMDGEWRVQRVMNEMSPIIASHDNYWSLVEQGANMGDRQYAHLEARKWRGLKKDDIFLINSRSIRGRIISRLRMNPTEYVNTWFRLDKYIQAKDREWEQLVGTIMHRQITTEDIVKLFNIRWNIND